MGVSRAELRLLGSTELATPLTATGGAVLRQPKRLALLAYLALASSEGYRRRDHIVALFWPELDQLHARTQLRKALYVLRGIVGADAFASRGDEEIRLDVARVWCDAVAFRRHCDAREWAEALALYRGELLEGLHPGGVGSEFEGWLQAQRESLRDLAARAAWECSSRADLAGDRDGALAFARRAADLSPDDEGSVRRLIAALDRYGDRAGALRIFEDWQSRLRQEYGAEPAPETRKLARTVSAPRKGESAETPEMLRARAAERREASAPGAAELEASPGPAVPAPPAEPEPARAPAPARHRVRPPRGALPRGTLPRAALLLGALLVVAVLTAAVARRYAASAPPAIAVLPLRGLGDAATAVAGESIAEELTTALARLPGVTVRSSARGRAALAGSPADLRAIGRRLDVTHVVEGGVAGDQRGMRVTVRLVRVADGATRWAGAFDADAASLLAAQQRIAAAAAAAAGPMLARPDR